MNPARVFLPYYNKFLHKFTRGKGYGKNKFVRKALSFFDWMFRDQFVNVYGHIMHLPPKGFNAYSTSGIYGELDTITVESIVQKGDYVLDIGAAIGYYTLILRRAVSDSGKVFAFEPKQDRFQFLKENLQINKYENVEIKNAAIFPNNVKPQFFRSTGPKGGLRHLRKKLDSHIAVDIETIDLDSFFKNDESKEKISFIKIDVDGSELYVLQSALSILKNKRLNLFIEWDPEASINSGCDPKEIIEILVSNNFKIYYPNYKNKNYFEINPSELLSKKSENTINLLCKKL